MFSGSADGDAKGLGPCASPNDGNGTPRGGRCRCVASGCGSTVSNDVGDTLRREFSSMMRPICLS